MIIQEITDSGCTHTYPLTECKKTVVIKSVTTNSFNNTRKDVTQSLNLIYDCCWMAADEILFGEQQLEILKKSNPNHDENLHLTSYKLVNFQNLIDKEKLKFKHWAGKHMPLLSIIVTTLFVVFLSFMFCCFCC